jgi:hypothetical protein
MMALTDLVCSKCVGRRTVNNIMMKVNSKVIVTTVLPDRPLAHTMRPFFVSASVQAHKENTIIFKKFITNIKSHCNIIRTNSMKRSLCFEADSLLVFQDIKIYPVF